MVSLFQKPTRGLGILLLILCTTIALTKARADYDDPDEENILHRGPVSTHEHLLGGLLSIVPGFGIGQAVEGRFSERGWIFAVGEAASIGLAIAAGNSCLFGPGPATNCGMTTAFFVIAGLFKVWEVGDAVIAPLAINREYERLHWKQNRVYTGFNVIPAPIGKEKSPGVVVSYNF